MSSTLPVSKKFTSEQKEIYDITLVAHQAAIDALGYQKPFRDAHIAACSAIFDGMKTMGFTKGNTADAVEAGAHALFFPCGTGHMMGLVITSYSIHYTKLYDNPNARAIFILGTLLIAALVGGAPSNGSH